MTDFTGPDPVGLCDDVILMFIFPGGSALKDSAFGYFITACVVIVLAIVAYVALPKMVRPDFMSVLNFPGLGLRKNEIGQVFNF